MTLSDYDSDQDVDYVPSKEVSDDESIEYDSASSVEGEGIVAEVDVEVQEADGSEGEEQDENQYARFVSMGGKLEVEDSEEASGEVADEVQDAVDVNSTDEDGDA